MRAGAAGRCWVAGVLALSVVSCGGGQVGGEPDGALVRDGTIDDGAIDDGAVDDGAIDGDAGPGGLGPPYPIVLAHGFFGFEEFAGIDFVTYFFGVKEELARHGETLVLTPAVDPFNDSERRGAQLLAQIETFLAESGHRRVNIIGHSQGGLDARWVAHERPDLVASVTTYATPHLGTPIADVVLGIVEDERIRDLADALVRLIGAPLWDASGAETSVFAALRQLSSEGVASFNSRVTDAEGVAYFSLTGRTDRQTGGADCAPDDASLRYVSARAWVLDPVDPLLDIAEQIIDGGTENIVNDGLVRARDARWGRFLGCVPADHLDEIGHLVGDSPGLGNDFDQRQLFVALVAWLRAEGL